MDNRPQLDTKLDSSTFRKWYWLKEELVSFCRDNGLPTSGGKEQLADRICIFLDTGKITSSSSGVRRSSAQTGEITPDGLIGENFVCSEKHRAFFKEQLGESFSFNVKFQKWLKSNPDKTYKDAVDAYLEIKNSKDKGRKEIDRQFEYNTYVRDFFEDNKGRSLDDAIKCWKYKKSLPGTNRYERSDLEILKEE
ncbi:MAG: SAP domain-containing protein [Clostridiales bacterium]|nr:SAP domain-containing protein [Clostridiales bacterium]